MQEQTKHPKFYRSGKLSILIPVFNERAYLRRCVERVVKASLQYNLQKEIILVDDGSTDGTAKVVRELAEEYPDMVRAFFLEENQGKGAAIRRAIQEMTGEYAIFQDADLEYDPNDYNIMLQAMKEGHADVVYGSRFATRTMRRVFNYHHALGNKFLTHLSNMTTGLDLTDMETCYKAFRADVLKTIPIRANRFGIEPEITAKVAKRSCTVFEVPISYAGRSYSEGKKIGWKDGVAAIYTILKYWLIDDCFDQQYAQAILNNLAHARRFNKWMVKCIEPYLGDRILEVGSGIGNISRLLPKKEKLIVTDVDPTYLEILEVAFKDNDIVDVARLDLTRRQDTEKLGESICDTVICLNVLEHIDDDVGALQNIHQLLAPGGRLVLLVPQYKWLFGSYDQHAGHVRRYTKAELTQKLEQADFRVLRFKNFNFLAIFGWWVNSCWLKKTNMDRWQLKIYDTMVPLLRVVEKLLPLPGISLICVAERQSSPSRDQ
ncbi:MAG: glycosyltransferase [Desulfobaccales bacterium]|nr:glycosyltransferase [Desulfobaccales bacterium]